MMYNMYCNVEILFTDNMAYFHTVEQRQQIDHAECERQRSIFHL
mgnify:CR=1 FL=1